MGEIIYKGKETTIVGTLLLGRHSSCDVQIADSAASRRHLELEEDEDGNLWVVDLGSANGTRLNGSRIEGRNSISHGDRITVGKSHLIIQDLRTREEHRKRITKAISNFKAESLIDKLIEGYRIQTVLGRGAMGVVYQAKQLTLAREVAMKVFRGDVLKADKSFAERLIEEARIAGKMDHKGFVHVHECGQQDNILWYSMEMVKGRTLAEVLDDGPLDVNVALAIGERLADAMDAAHQQNIVHRDIKPANIMVNDDGRVKILDLGLAEVLLEGRQSTNKDSVVGTPHYMSPEQARNDALDGRSDIYSLGCTLFHMLTGQPPYIGETPLETIAGHLQKDIPSLSNFGVTAAKYLDPSMRQLLAKDPDHRFASMQICSDHLHALRQNLIDDGTLANSSRLMHMPKGILSKKAGSGIHSTSSGFTAVLILTIILGALLALAYFLHLEKQSQSEHSDLPHDGQ